MTDMFTVEGFRGIVAFIDDPARPVVPVPFAMPIPAFAPPLGIAIRSDLLERSVLDFNNFECASYVALEGGCQECVKAAFGKVQFIDAEGEIAFITEKMSEQNTLCALDKLSAKGAKIKSRIRIL